MKKIKVIIAEDNKEINNFIKQYLENYEEIEILGSAYTNLEEIKLIENVKPEIVITDLLRNNILSGLEIIKKYKQKSKTPKFLVITANSELIDPNIMDGFISKPILNYEIIIQQLRKIKELIESEK